MSYMTDMTKSSIQVPAMCYVPWQKWSDLYEPALALKKGTLFKVLDKPFAKNGNCGGMKK